MTVSIRPYTPFELVYTEELNTRSEAIAREKYFKTAAGRKFLKKYYSRSTMPGSQMSDVDSIRVSEVNPNHL